MAKDFREYLRSNTLRAAIVIFMVLAVLSIIDAIIFSIVRIILGLLFVLLIPGLLASYAFFRKEDIDVIERIGVSIGLSISLVILTVMFSNIYLKIPINLFSILSQISIICILLLGIIYLRGLPATSRFVGRLKVASVNRRKNIVIIFGVILIASLLAVDIFYPYLFVQPTQNATIPEYAFDELYNISMTVYEFYPQENIARNLTGVNISIPFPEIFDNKIAFLGYGINNTDLKAGDSFHIAYFWKSLEKVDTNYAVFVHFIDDNESVIFQQDHLLPIPTSKWNVGDVIMEEHEIKLPLDLKNNRIYILIGLYDQFGTGERLPIVYGQSIYPENRIKIGEISIIG